MRLLLLQIRDLASVREEEYQSFLRYCGLQEDELDVLNVFDTPSFGPDAIAGYDALLVGGASEASVLEPHNYPFVPDCVALLQHCIEIDFPVFVSCFGFQLAVLALGGDIIRDTGAFEMGTLPISLRGAAANDLLFGDVTDGFYAVAVHRERAPVCPEGATELAYTSKCCHAFKVDNKRFWAFQFHPEVDRATLVSRLTAFKSAYTDGDEQLAEVLGTAVETPESNDLMRKFVDRVLR